MTGHKINLHFTLCSLPLSTYRSGWPPLIWSNKTEIEMWGGAALLLLISLRAIRASVHVPSTPPQHLLRLRLFGGLSIILMQFKDLHSTPELPWQQSPPPPTPPHPPPPPSPTLSTPPSPRCWKINRVSSTVWQEMLRHRWSCEKPCALWPT